MKANLISFCLAAGLVLQLPAIAHAQYTFTTNNDGSLNIASYTGSVGAVIIPDTTNNLPITSIGTYSFAYISGLTSVTIGTNVTSVGDDAFEYCGGLTNVSIPKSASSIGFGAFAYCVSLQNITIPKSVTSIGSEAFLGCYLMTITVAANNSAYSSSSEVLFNKTKTIVIQCAQGKAGHYTVPNSVTNIQSHAFDTCTSLTGVTIDTNVTSIGDSAFHNCTSLTSITIPNSVTSIGSAAFFGCGNLASATIGNSVTNIGDSAFLDCTSLSSVIIPNSVGDIGDYAFYNCSRLTNVTIGSNVMSIGNDALYGCVALKSLVIPNSVSFLLPGAFAGCTNLMAVYFQGNAPLPNNDPSVFFGDGQAIVYPAAGTTGWTASFDGILTWNPCVQTNDTSFGVQANRFGFLISGNSNLVVMVDCCTNLASPNWTPLGTNTLNTFVGTNGTYYFSDSKWTNDPYRFYRMRSP